MNLYHWHDEKMAEYKMRDIEREIQQARLLKEAGLSNTGGLTRMVRGVLELLKPRKNEKPELETLQHSIRPGKAAR